MEANKWQSHFRQGSGQIFDDDRIFFMSNVVESFFDKSFYLGSNHSFWNSNFRQHFLIGLTLSYLIPCIDYQIWESGFDQLVISVDSSNISNQIGINSLELFIDNFENSLSFFMRQLHIVYSDIGILSSRDKSDYIP